MRAWLAPFAFLFRAVTGARGFLYDQGAFKSESIAAKVVVIGNITAGGTGKTPLTAMITQRLRARGLRVGIVSRGYKGRYKGIQRVPWQVSDADLYGDEPSWMAQELGADIPVYVGRKRVEAARALVAKENVQVVLADDAFQHRRLKRDFNVVIIDATEPLWHYRSLPMGRAREPLTALKRADAVVVNKINFVDAARLEELKRLIRPHLRPQVAVIDLSYALSGLGALDKEGEWPLETIGELKVFLVSALGRPASFESLVREQAGQITGHLTFRDHHSYTKADALMIEKTARAAGAQAIVMTQKDAVKLRRFAKELLTTLPVFVTCLSLQGPGCDQLDQEIRQKIF